MKLHLVLKRKWYDMEVSGVKQEEYRDRTPYWKKRIWDRRGKIESVVMHCGYTNKTTEFKLIDIIEGAGRPQWGAEPGKVYYVLKLGNAIK